jgi:hypothetical protein
MNIRKKTISLIVTATFAGLAMGVGIFLGGQKKLRQGNENACISVIFCRLVKCVLLD